MKTTVYKALILVLVTPLLVNCSGMKFAGTSSDAADSTGPSPSPTPTPGPTNVTPPAQPELRFVGPPCQQQSNCEADFEMVAAVSGTFAFDWATNDVLYLQTPPAGSGIVYGKPGQDYTPASGHVVFAPGATLEKAFIQNTNKTTSTITIGVIMTGCSYAGVAADCDTFFK